MGRGTQEVIVNTNDYVGYKINDSGIDDNDINKPVKLSAVDLVALCSDGDQVYGWISAISPHTQDGKVWVTVQIGGRKFCNLSGTSSAGALVEAAANTSAGVANAGDWGLVSTHTKVTATEKMWKIISGTLTDGGEVLIEKQ